MLAQDAPDSIHSPVETGARLIAVSPGVVVIAPCKCGNPACTWTICGWDPGLYREQTTAGPLSPAGAETIAAIEHSLSTGRLAGAWLDAERTLA